MAECQSVRLSEIKNGRLRLYGAKHCKCNHMMTPGFKGLTTAHRCILLTYWQTLVHFEVVIMCYHVVLVVLPC